MARRSHAAVEFTGNELDALNTLLSVVLNDPDWPQTRAEAGALGRCLDKVQAALRKATR